MREVGGDVVEESVRDHGSAADHVTTSKALPNRHRNVTSRRVHRTVVAALLALGLGGASIFIWLRYGRENFHVVVDGSVFRSSQPTPTSLKRYRDQRGLRTVINLRGCWPGLSWYEAERSAADDLGLVTYDIMLTTHRLAPPGELRKLVQALDQAPRPLLLHCRHGADRTALAVALELALHQGKSIEESKQAYHWKYGHSPWAWGWGLPHLFDLYQADLRQRGDSHSPENLRAWIENLATVGYFAAEIKPSETPTSVSQPVHLKVVARNASPFPWRLASRWSSGISLRGAIAPAGASKKSWVRAYGSPRDVLPGAVAQFEIVLPVPDARGPAQLDLDLVDAHGITFRQMEGGGWTSALERAPESTTHGSTPVADHSKQEGLNDEPGIVADVP